MYKQELVYLHERTKVPTVLDKKRHNGFRFFFWSNEEDRAHVHIEKGDNNAKYWLEPEIACVYSYGFSPSEINFIEKTIKAKYNILINKWNE